MEAYAGQQVVGMDLHRRRSVIVRMDDQGHGLETIRISNDVDRLTEVMARAGVPIRKWCWKRRKAGTGRPTRWRRWVPRSTWPTRWG